MAKEKSININIKNTNVIKDKTKRKKRRRTKKQNLLNSDKKVLSNPYQYPMQTFITPPMNFNTNEEAKKYSRNYLLLNDKEDANKNNLLLLEGKKDDNDKNTLLLGKPMQLKNNLSIKPVKYTYKSLMGVKTLSQLRNIMKNKAPDIPNEVLDEITNLNKGKAVLAFLKHIGTPMKSNIEEINEPTITIPETPKPKKLSKVVIKKSSKKMINQPNELKIEKFTKNDLQNKTIKEIKDLLNINYPKLNYSKKLRKEQLINLFIQQENNDESFSTPKKDINSSIINDETIYDNDNNLITPHSNHLLESIKDINKNLKKNLKKINKEKAKSTQDKDPYDFYPNEQEFKIKSPLLKYSKMIESPTYDDDPVTNDLLNSLIKTGVEKYGYTPEESRNIASIVKNKLNPESKNNVFV